MEMISIITTIIATTFPFFLRVTLSSLFSHGYRSSNDQSSKNNLKKGPWTVEEDEILAAYVTKQESGNWNIVQKNTGLLRCGKNCCLRWTNHLRTDLRRGAFSKEEQSKVIQLHALMGNKWAKMAQEMPGQTDNEIKNFWNTRLKKRKRVGLGIYPDEIKPVLNAQNPETSLAAYTHSVNDSEACTSSCVPRVLINNFDNTQNQPLCVPPISEAPEDLMQLSLEDMMQLSEFLQNHDHNEFLGYGDYECSGGPSSISEMPPLSSSQDELPFGESMIVREDPQVETNEYYEPRSPHSNGYLESIFYPPKVSQEPNNSSMQGELNAENKENYEDRKLENENVFDDFNRVQNQDNDPDPNKDTLFSIIYPFLPRQN